VSPRCDCIGCRQGREQAEARARVLAEPSEPRDVALGEALLDLAAKHCGPSNRDAWIALVDIRSALQNREQLRVELERTKLALAEARAHVRQQAEFREARYKLGRDDERASVVRAVRAAAEGHDAMGRVGVAPHLRLLADLVEAGDHCGREGA
jgi:hypothetical protein